MDCEGLSDFLWLSSLVSRSYLCCAVLSDIMLLVVVPYCPMVCIIEREKIGCPSDCYLMIRSDVLIRRVIVSVSE